MRPRHSHGPLRYLLVGLFIAALIVLFPITAKSHRELAALALALL